MPYTVQILGTREDAYRFVAELRKRTSKRFSRDRFDFDHRIVDGTREVRSPHITDFDAGVDKRCGFVSVELTKIRLHEKRPYCGQHPGPCVLGRPKRSSRCLEWDDWVRFNGIVNDVLDRFKMYAHVYSKPMETDQRMWMRYGHLRRHRYEWKESYSMGRPIRRWNHGTLDQFQPET